MGEKISRESLFADFCELAIAVSELPTDLEEYTESFFGHYPSNGEVTQDTTSKLLIQLYEKTARCLKTFASLHPVLQQWTEIPEEYGNVQSFPLYVKIESTNLLHNPVR